MSAMIIEVENRRETGKNVARRIRAAGRIPAVVYGGGKETVPITVDRKRLQDYFRGGARDNSIFLLEMKGTDQKRHAMIRKIDIDPVSQTMVHLDFIRVDMDHKLKVHVPFVLVNTAACVGVKTGGGVIDFSTRDVELECLPGDIPESIAVDVQALEIGHFIRLSEVTIDKKKYRVIGDQERVVVSVAHPQKEEVVAPEEAAAAAPAEPEVIKKGKKEEEGAAAAETKPAGGGKK